MPAKSKKASRRAQGRKNPLASEMSVQDYLYARRRSVHQMDVLFDAAHLGLSFADGMQVLLKLRGWSASSRNQRWLQQAGGEQLAAGFQYFRGKVRPHLVEGFLRDAADLSVHAQSVYRLAGRVFKRMTSESRTRELVVACSNELNMLAVFATRSARRARLAEPTATELAALAVQMGAEKETSSLEEKDRRIDKFRKILDSLPRIESSLDELMALRSTS